jgi:drug/metabolite transporter (DMT)-like permease
MLFWYSLVGLSAALLILVIESLVTWMPWRFLTYTGAQYGWMLLASFISNLSLVANIIAAKNEKTAIIQMIGYVSLIYAFLGDFLIFKLSLSPMQLVGVSIVAFFFLSQ